MLGQEKNLITWPAPCTTKTGNWGPSRVQTGLQAQTEPSPSGSVQHSFRWAMLPPSKMKCSLACGHHRETWGLPAPYLQVRQWSHQTDKSPTQASWHLQGLLSRKWACFFPQTVGLPGCSLPEAPTFQEPWLVKVSPDALQTALPIRTQRYWRLCFLFGLLSSLIGQCPGCKSC